MKGQRRAKAKLVAWKASLKNQKARLFMLEEAKRHQARIDMQAYVKNLNGRVQFDTFFKSPIDEGPGIKEAMDRVNLSLLEIECSASVIWALMDDNDIIEADFLVDSFYEDEARESIALAAQHMTEEHPAIKFSDEPGEITREMKEIHSAKIAAIDLSLSGTDPTELELFWKTFERRIGGNQYISSQDKFEILKACCIQEAADFTDSLVWHKDPSADRYLELKEALRAHFTPKSSMHCTQNMKMEAPAFIETETAKQTNRIQYAQENSKEVVSEEARSVIPEVALAKKAIVMIQDESFQVNEISMIVHHKINQATAIGSALRSNQEDSTPVSCQERNKEIANQAVWGTAIKAQDTRISRPVEAVLEVNTVKALGQRISQPLGAVLGNTAANCQDVSQPIMEIGTALLSTGPLTMQEVLSWTKKLRISNSALNSMLGAVFGNTAANGQTTSQPIMEIGISSLPTAPVTMQEVLSWLKKLKIFCSALYFTSPLHASASVNIQELLTWIPTMRTC